MKSGSGSGSGSLLFLLVGLIACQVDQTRGHYDPITVHLKRAGPAVAATSGQPWPKPQLVHNVGDSFMILRPLSFTFKTVPAGHTCALIEEAFKRYYAIILKSNGGQQQLQQSNSSGGASARDRTPSFKTQKKGRGRGFSGYLDTLQVHLMSPCEDWPHEAMDESYEIKINTPDLPNAAMLVASSNWGLLHGLETFSQLIHLTGDGAGLQVKGTIIVDYPRFSFRSLLLDTSRHFLSKAVLLQNLDLMAANKLNVFHWHMTDDQAFPFQSDTFPGLSDKGAYHPYTHVYTKADVAEIVHYARLRGIRVIPEFDTPGHTQSWGPGLPGLLTKCYNKEGEPDGTFGPIDVSRAANYAFLRALFQEIVNTFPDKTVHLGGDEVESDCWKSNPSIDAFMARMNYSGDYTRLEDYHMGRMADILRSFTHNHSALVWQELFDRAVELDRAATIVHVWKDDPFVHGTELGNVTRAGFRAVLSSCWYLNYISYGLDWTDYYKCDPQAFNGTAAQKRLVLGGGVAMWGELVDSTNLIPRTWPRAAAPAERLWSHVSVNDTEEAAPRLEEHRCRLLRRGFSVQPPNGPGFCL